MLLNVKDPMLDDLDISEGEFTMIDTNDLVHCDETELMRYAKLIEDTVDLTDAELFNIVLITEEGRPFSEEGREKLEEMAQRHFSEPIQHFCHYQGAFLNDPEKLCNLLRKLNAERTIVYLPITKEYGRGFTPEQRCIDSIITVLTEFRDYYEGVNTSFGIICNWMDDVDRKNGITPLSEREES